MVGYNQLPTTPPLAPITAKVRPEARAARLRCGACLARAGLPGDHQLQLCRGALGARTRRQRNPIRLLNPIASQMSVMRSSLLGSLLQVLKFNLDRKAERVRVFELGRVFSCATLRRQYRHHGAKASTSRCVWRAWPMATRGAAVGLQGQGLADFFDVKGDVEALLARAADSSQPASGHAPGPLCPCVWLDGKPVGFVGELHPRWRQRHELAHAPVMFELELDAVLQRPVPQFQPVPKFQPVGA
jgi:phenylalanyl-tRNA synthetase beta chain